MNPIHHSEFASIAFMAVCLTFSTIGWMWQSEWGQSSSVFFGVRVPERFDDSLDAIPIRMQYDHTIKLIPVVLLALYTLLLHFGLVAGAMNSRSVLYGFVLLQAIAVRAAFWRARNQTLPFAAPPETTRSASFSELRAPSLTWRLLYWSAVIAPLPIVGYVAVYVWSHWLALHLPIDSNLRLPLTVDSPPVVWRRREVFAQLRWVVVALLMNLDAVVLAFAFNFRSRISEWGEEAVERHSYRRQLMLYAVVLQWTATLASLLTVFNPAILASSLVRDHLLQYMLLTLPVLTVISYLLPLWLLNRLYDNRPPGFVNKATDQHWKFGLYYVNSDDSAAIVPARFGVGESLNFAHPLAWAILVLSVAGIVLRFAVPDSVVNLPSVQASANTLSEDNQIAFFSDKAALQGGEFQASERLLHLAGHTYNPDLWSSIAFVLAQNQVKPDTSHNWAASAVSTAENYDSRLDLSNPTQAMRQDMAHLAALWSDLGFVCLQHRQRDTNCAQRYLLAAQALDPHPSYVQLLTNALQNQPPAAHYDVSAYTGWEQGVINLNVSGSPGNSTLLDIVLTSHGETTVYARSGRPIDQQVVSAITDTLRFPWPDGSRTKLLVRGSLTCPPDGKPCTLAILRPL